MNKRELSKDLSRVRMHFSRNEKDLRLADNRLKLKHIYNSGHIIPRWKILKHASRNVESFSYRVHLKLNLINGKLYTSCTKVMQSRFNPRIR